MKAKRLNRKECRQLLDLLFPQGFGSPEIKEEIIQEGWKNSPLRKIFHPTPEQVQKESVEMQRNLDRLSGKKTNVDEHESQDELEEFRKFLRNKPDNPEREFLELVGKCVWDIFSNNHEIIAPDGRTAKWGPHRTAAAILAWWINAKENNQPEFYYLDFYRGSAMVSGRADLSPVYQMIFRRIKQAGGDWIYHFPRLYLVDLSREKPAEQDDPEKYDPAKAIADKREKNQAINKFKKGLEQANREAIERAIQSDPPRVVAAYTQVFGNFPKGWPPK